MDRQLLTIVFITWAHLSQACIVKQSPSLLVTLKGEVTTINCDVRIPPNRGTLKIETWITFKGEGAKIAKILNNETTHSVVHNVYATESGNYKCLVTCGSTTVQGKGTFIYVRDTGYRDPATPADKLQSGLIALFVLLLLPAILGSYLVLPFFWKKQVKQPKPSSVSAVPPATPKPPQPEEEASGSMYASLQQRSEDVYDVLDEDPAKKTNMKHQAEIHGVPGLSPMRRPKPQAPPTPVQEKPRLVPDKPPTKQKTNKVNTDSSLYENFKR